MLEAMRNGANNIFVKVFLGVLALSFVVWGIGDVFRGRTSTDVATVGDYNISLHEYSNAYRGEVARYQQLLGGVLTEEQISGFGLKRQVLRKLIDEKIILQRINELNIKVGDKVARDRILKTSAFYGEKGAFDKKVFENILKANGINKNEYINSLKTEAAINIFIDSVAVEPLNVQSAKQALYGYRNEERLADVITFSSNYIQKVDEPSDADLIQYYQDNTHYFDIPEMRGVSYITIDAAIVKSNVKISDKELQEYYEASKDLFAIEEQRDVVQYLFDTKEAADNAYKDLKQGKTSKYKDLKLDFGKSTYDQLPEEVKDVVFSLPVGDYSNPLQTDLGWHVFVNKSIIDPYVQSFSEVKNEIKNQLTEERASEEFFTIAEQIEDEFAEGKKISDIAEQYDLILHTINSLDTNGNGVKGAPVKGLPDIDTFISLAFSTDEGTESPVTLLKDNLTYLVLTVNSVSPSRTKALDEARGMAINLWKEEQKIIQLENKANQLASKIKSDGGFYKLAKKHNLKINRSKNFSRPSSNSFLDGNNVVGNSLSSEIFSLVEDDTTNAYKNEEGGFDIAKLVEIKKAEDDTQKISSLQNDLKDDFTDDILSQYNLFLRTKYPVEINETILNSSN